jgi:hypothetical protein
VDWIHLAQDSDQWGILVNTKMKPWVSQNENIFIAEELAASIERIY